MSVVAIIRRTGMVNGDTRQSAEGRFSSAFALLPEGVLSCAGSSSALPSLGIEGRVVGWRA